MLGFSNVLLTQIKVTINVMIAVAVTDTMKVTANVMTATATLDNPELPDISSPEKTSLYDYSTNLIITICSYSISSYYILSLQSVFQNDCVLLVRFRKGV